MRPEPGTNPEWTPACSPQQKRDDITQDLGGEGTTTSASDALRPGERLA